MIDYISKAGVLSSILRNDAVENDLMTKEEHQDVKAIFTMKDIDGEGQASVGKVAILTSGKLIVIYSLKNRDHSWVEKMSLHNIIGFKKVIKRVFEYAVPIFEVTEVVLTVAGREPIEIKRPNENSGVSDPGWKDYEDFVKKLEELIN